MKRSLIIIISVILSISILLSLLFFLNMRDYFCSKNLTQAIKNNDYVTAKKIISENPECINTFPSISTSGWRSAMNISVVYPLTQACMMDNVEMVKLLISNGADVNCNDGLTPLSVTYTSKKENWYVISEILIENGASPDYTTQYSGEKSTVLQDIVQTRPGANDPNYIPDNKCEVMAAFNYALENCDHSKVEWMRVLQDSVSNDRIEIVKLLLDEGYCNVNDTSVGMTALMFAARDSTPEMVQLLLDYGADESIKSTDGKTAYDYAFEYNDDKRVAEILK